MKVQALIAAAGVAFAGAAQAQVKLKFSSIEPPVAAITARVLIPWAKEVSAASNGALEVEMFAGGTLGRSIQQQVKLVQDGVADITWTAPSFTPGRFQGHEIAELPFLIRNAREGSLAVWRMYEQGLFAGFDEFKVLLLGTTSPQFINGRTPMRTLEVIKGKRISAGGPVRAKTLDALGAVPVQLPPPAIAEALSKGVIDAVLGEWNYVQTFKVDEVANDFFELPLGSDVLMVIMLKSKYDALPPAARSAIDKYSGEPLVRRLIELFETNDRAVRERVAKDGKRAVGTPSAETVAAFRKVTDPVVTSWRKENPQNERRFQAFEAEVAKLR